MFQQNIGYLNFIVLIFVCSGYLILRVDVKHYTKANLVQEGRLARFLGWTNISLGITVLVFSIISSVVASLM
ncbi:hypothetical protein KZ483_16650 [Paenibacillus sp. sptzw28]|uniref:CLC_0170 family protein n=1 Tax=Paenibacillus sp. sptzw28 TaxID=715179 RepID=UPI001C6F3F05|nr:CLC_0170 family protein [Paenibacillus sp. sptzw28]QYR19538.1 hypothetical protein KZ483_16650 [Paenibacillus sp. sptzw28]